LRQLKGYDSYNTLLLPPRTPGEKLPPEVYEYFKEINKSKEEQMKAKYLENLAQDNGKNSMWRVLGNSHCPGPFE
jgi:hydrocephalus-inducing protein